MFGLGKLPILTKLLTTGDISGGIKGALNEVQKVTSLMSGAAEALGKAGAASPFSKAGGAGAFGKVASGMGSQMAASLSALQPGATQKLLYLSILRQAMEKASQSQHFNVETHINDLWIKLSQIRQNEADITKLQQAMEQQQELMKTVSNILKKYDETAKNVVQNLR